MYVLDSGVQRLRKDNVPECGVHALAARLRRSFDCHPFISLIRGCHDGDRVCQRVPPAYMLVTDACLRSGRSIVRPFMTVSDVWPP
jgi:hypothetical protein